MHRNEELLDRFYRALQRSDYDDLAGCYHPEAVYWDPVFRELRGRQALAMWHLLCDLGPGLDVRFGDVSADEERGSARWEARYAFSRTGRPVVNQISSAFRFRDGLIAEQRDSFSTYRWARMALGPVGHLLGWSPPLRYAVHRQARRTLTRYLPDEDAGG